MNGRWLIAILVNIFAKIFDNYETRQVIACSRPRDSGETAYWKNEREKRVGMGRDETATAIFSPDPARLIFAFPF